MPLRAEFLGGLGDGLGEPKRLLLPQLIHAVALDLGVGGDFFEFVVAFRKRREIEAEGLGDAAGFLVAIPIAPALRIVAHDKNAGFGERAIEGLHTARATDREIPPGAGLRAMRSAGCLLPNPAALLTLPASQSACRCAPAG